MRIGGDAEVLGAPSNYRVPSTRSRQTWTRKEKANRDAKEHRDQKKMMKGGRVASASVVVLSVVAVRACNADAEVGAKLVTEMHHDGE